MEKQKTLFGLPEPVIPHVNKSGITCRHCKFRYKHQYGKMFYCSKQKQKGTSYGDKKIKASDQACNLYELKG